MLTLEHVSFDVKGDRGEKGIIKDLSMTLDDGKFVVITGPNGGGKSTLAKLIAGIERPTEGRIYFDGTDITDMSITDRANMGISFAFQQPVRFKGVQVLDLIRLAAKKNMSAAEACQYLSEVGLCAKDYINREVNASLSGLSFSCVHTCGPDTSYAPSQPFHNCICNFFLFIRNNISNFRIMDTLYNSVGDPPHTDNCNYRIAGTKDSENGNTGCNNNAVQYLKYLGNGNMAQPLFMKKNCHRIRSSCRRMAQKKNACPDSRNNTAEKGR